MPNYRAPGVYVEETNFQRKAIEGVETSATAFVGMTRRGPFAVQKRPRALSSFASFEKVYGGLNDLAKFSPATNYVAHAAKAFFDEGGKRLYVARVKTSIAATIKSGAKATAGKNRLAGKQDWEEALHAVSALDDVSIIAAPGSTEFGLMADTIQSLLVAHAEMPRAYRFAVLDVPKGKKPTEARDYVGKFNSKSAAFYYPWVTVSNPNFNANNPASQKDLMLPPSGFICGIYARSDMERGVFKAPANEVIRGAIGLERQITAAEQDVLNPAGVNCLRYFKGKGYCVWGARTASSDPEWKYVNLCRYMIYLEHSIDNGTQWAVFEPNDEKLWATVRNAISNFLQNEWRSGALQGRKSEEALFVKCDRTTMTQNDLDQGRLICVVGVALIKPAEFVIVRIGQWTADARCQ